MTDQLRLMAVHAHPDDESSKGAATMAKYVSEGVDVLVVTCTGGERGSILNPKLQGDKYIEEHIHEVRKKEMDEAREILGVGQVRLRLTDRPGALATLLGVLSAVDANVLDVSHVRTDPRLGLTEVEVELHLETRGPKHCAEVNLALRQAGYIVLD